MNPESSFIFPVLQHVYHISSIFGLSIFSLKTLSLKPMALLYILLLFLPVAYNIGGLLSWVLAPTELPKTAVFFITQNDSLVYIMALLSWILLLVRYKNHVETLREIFIISGHLDRVGIIHPVERLQRVQSLYSAGLLVLLCVKYILDYVVDTDDSHWLGFYLADATNNTVILQFINCMWLLQELYRIVNDRLDRFIQEGPLYDHFIFQKSLFHTPVRSIFSSKTAISTRVDIESDRDLLLKDLRMILNSVFSLSRTINFVYSLQLLLYMANFIVEFTVSLYMLYYSGVYKVTDKELVDSLFWAYISYLVTVILSDSFQIVIMINSSEDVTDEANNTAVLVHKLMTQDLPPRTMEELQLFSYQLLHQKVNFSVCGFFNLDFTLLNGVIASVATYLVILIQFQM